MARQRTKLNAREQAFVRAYLTGETRGVALTSAHAAGFGPNDTSIGSKLLQRPLVRDAIERRLAKHEIRAERVLAELSRVAYSDMRDYVEWGPDGVRLKPSSELSDLAAVAVAEVSETTTKDGGSLKFKLHDKLGALVGLAKHLRLLDGEGADTTRPIQVNIGVAGPAQVSVNGHDLPAADPGPPLRTDGLRLHADGGNGAGA